MAMNREHEQMFGEPHGSDRVPDWFAKLVIAVLGSLGFGLSCWALSEVHAQDGRIIRNETQIGVVLETLKEIKDDLKEIKSSVKRP